MKMRNLLAALRERLTPRKFVALWTGGVGLLIAAVLWTTYILWPGIFQGVGPLRTESPLPEVELNPEAQAFVEALPELGRNAQSPADDTPHMVIPRLNVDEPIFESRFRRDAWYIDGLESRIAHLEGTDAPGGTGNAAFAGHISLSDNSPGPLANVERLVPGDTILVIYGPVTYQYEVTGQQQVGEDRLDVLYPTDSHTLTLVTCSSWSWLNGRYTSRQVVTARLHNVTNS